LLLSIINDLLDLSKIEAGKMELLNNEYEVASLVSDVVQLNIMRIESKPIEFELHIDEHMPAHMMGDELRVKQILNNLLSNAFKYTAAGKVMMSVTSEAHENNDAEIVLVATVNDTGPGMTKEQIRQLFDEYSRFHLEANRMTEGTGLGMSITRNLAQLMNGDIFVESTPGEGSTFTVRIPQGRFDPDMLGREKAENLRHFRAHSKTQMQRAQITFEPMPYGSILIVDDVEMNLYVAKGLLAPYGLKIDTADNGFTAIEKIKHGETYDVVFMDHMMPGLDGIEATKILRGMGYDRPIVALTANAVAGQADIFLKSGFNDFVSKPVDIRLLNGVLNKLIRDTPPPEVIEAARQQKIGRSAGDSSLHPSMELQLAKAFARDAEKAVITLEAICANQYRRGADMQMYVINAHAMKSVLANIGETELAAVAQGLEQAGRKMDLATMSAETPAFLDALRAMIKKVEPKEEDEGSETSETTEDQAYLREKLVAMQAACAAYDKKAAKDALAELSQKKWSRPTKKQLDTIVEHLLDSDFEEAASVAKQMIQGDMS